MNQNTQEVTQEPIYKLHRRMVEAQGRKISWIAKMLDCSYSHVHKHLNGYGMMSKEKVEQLHKILHTIQK